MGQELKKNYFIALDDDPMVHLIIEQMLKMPAVPFASAAKLVSRASQYDPVAAFVDIHLGTEESGIQILPQLRRAWPFRPIIVITSDPDPQFISEALSLGANDFVRKPLDETELRARTSSRILEMQRQLSQDTIACGDVTLYRRLHLVRGSKGERYVSPGETMLLEHLFAAPGILLPKQDLKGKVWGSLRISDNAVDRKVSLLRKNLSDVSSHLRLVAKYGKGICLETGSDGKGDV